MNKSYVFLPLLMGLLVFQGCKKEGGNAAGGGNGKKNQGPVGVEGLVIKPERLDNAVTVSGSLVSNEIVEIRPEISGRIVRLNLREGQSVAGGALLVKLYDADLQAQLKRLEAQKALSERTLERQTQLLKSNGISQQEVDITRTQITAFEAEMDLVRANLVKTEIRAPFAGILGLKLISSGAVVSPATLLGTLQQTNPLIVEFALPEKYGNEVGTGMSVRFLSEQTQGMQTATIYAADPQIDPNTRTRKFRAHVANPGGRMQPGAFVKVEVPLKSNQNAILVPTQAILTQARGKQAVVSRGGKATMVPVTTGRRTETNVEVTEGLTPGDTVITKGTMFLKPGSALKFVKVL